MSKSIKKNFIYNILLNISKVIFPLVSAPYVARVLEPDGVGLFNFANTYAYNFALFAALGIPLYGMREIAKIQTKEDKEKFVSEMISTSFFSMILFLVFYVLSLIFVDKVHENYVYFLISGIYFYVTPLRIDWFYYGIEEFRYITLRSLLIKTISILLLFIFIRNKEDLLLYVFLNTMCLVLNELWNYYKLLKMGIRPKITLGFGHHIKPLLLLFASTVAISVYTMLDTLMLGFLSSYEQVAYYNSAAHISKAMLPIVTSLAAVVIPRLSQFKETKQWDEINQLNNKSLSVVAFLSIPITIGIILIAPSFVPLFFGEQFIGAILPLQIMALVVIIIGLSNLTGQQILVALGYDKCFLYSVLVGTFSNICFNLVLIPIYGAIGATIASVISETLVLLMMFVFIRKETPIIFGKKKEFLSTTMICMGFIPIYYIVNTNSWCGVILFTALCAIYYLISQHFFKNSTYLNFYSHLKNKIHNVKSLSK